MKNTTQVTVVETNEDGTQDTWTLPLAQAVQCVSNKREDGDGSSRYSILTLSGQVVTRGMVRAAGL